MKWRGVDICDLSDDELDTAYKATMRISREIDDEWLKRERAKKARQVKVHKGSR